MEDLSQDQQRSISHLLEWYKKDKADMQFVTLGGFAGTGKTTLIAILRKKLHAIDKSLKVGFTSYTGKAARVLQNTLQQKNAILKQDTVGTIHSLIYTPIVNAQEEIVGWKTKEEIDCDVIIIDEASMIDGQIWEHLCQYKKPMIVVGDHGQLPPISGNFHLMQKPNITLTQIHRQAAQNPIIHLSVDARQTGHIQTGKYSDTVIKFDPNDPDTSQQMTELLNAFTHDCMILCGLNATRKRLNGFIRASLGFDSPEPMPSDRVICLRNNHKANIFNGMLGVIRSISKKDTDWYEAEIAMDGQDELYSGLISVKQFNADTALNFTNQRKHMMRGDLFDFGYALTVHKAQGSQAKRVILFEERFSKMDDEQWRRWLYTAVTRATDELYIFSSSY